ncbi:MAG: cyclic nucleotide-binding domain-containing protein [Gammaproteobacteria bacterium]|nr:cyclic nucleotide-binding domain-containing protein [Gammaproteobacteria bacterium]MBU1646569.1 cyclic nucleotide-binding domain-containing protein [Gammaproteobacteria bacterium]MBU1972826.1 cyclic nucleotide-binding domain-containing protein [Gammaproteobacteria bacterium]
MTQSLLVRLSPNLAGDFWGGLAAMLVALPSAIAFGVTIYSPLGASYAAYGALAGILGATALGLIAPALGGTQRLITAPCAPAAAVLSAFAIEFLQRGAALEAALLMLMIIGLMAGALQVIFGTVGLGRLIKYMPYPVVSGYLSGVGLIIIASQVPKFLGVPKEIHFWQSLLAADAWRWQGIVVGAVTIAVMVGSPRVTKRVPAAILGLAAGVLAYFGLGLLDPTLLVVEGNRLIVGPMGGGSGGGFSEAFMGRFDAMAAIDLAQLQLLLMPALTLAVLLSIDTLKTCVVLDALTRSRHDSNRELIGQGLGNMASGLIGGIPGAGTMGATLVNLSSGAASRLSGVMEGVLALLAFLLLASFIAWVPVAALAGILIVIGVRMIDRHSLQLLKSPHTILDFFVIIAVVAVALTIGLIPASATGIVLAIFLFIREQIGGSIVRRKAYGNQSFSKQIRLQDEMEILEQRGDQAVIVELQGALFFGTTDQLYSVLEPELKARKYIVLDMRRVQTIDVTAAHMLDQIRDMMADKGGYLVYSQLPQNLPSGKDMQHFFDQIGLAPSKSAARIFGELDAAQEWIENRILQEAALERTAEKPLDLHELALFKGRKEETLTALEQRLEKRSVKSGDRIFARGEAGDEIFLIRRGSVRIMLPLGAKQARHLSTFGRGDFFGEMAFLDGAARSADAIAYTEVELFVLSRKTFDAFADEHKKAALKLMEGLASVLTGRLRYANAELQALES